MILECPFCGNREFKTKDSWTTHKGSPDEDACPLAGFSIIAEKWKMRPPTTKLSKPDIAEFRRLLAASKIEFIPEPPDPSKEHIDDLRWVISSLLNRIPKAPQANRDPMPDVKGVFSD